MKETAQIQKKRRCLLTGKRGKRETNCFAVKSRVSASERVIEICSRLRQALWGAQGDGSGK